MYVSISQNIQSRTSCNIPTLETMEMFIDSRVDNHTAVCSYDGVSHSKEKEQTTATPNKMGESQTNFDPKSFA